MRLCVALPMQISHKFFMSTDKRNNPKNKPWLGISAGCTARLSTCYGWVIFAFSWCERWPRRPGTDGRERRAPSLTVAPLAAMSLDKNMRMMKNSKHCNGSKNDLLLSILHTKKCNQTQVNPQKSRKSYNNRNVVTDESVQMYLRFPSFEPGWF